MVIYRFAYFKVHGIEISHSAAVVIAHLAVDGNQAWTIKEPDRYSVDETLVLPTAQPL